MIPRPTPSHGPSPSKWPYRWIPRCSERFASTTNRTSSSTRNENNQGHQDYTRSKELEESPVSALSSCRRLPCSGPCRLGPSFAVGVRSAQKSGSGGHSKQGGMEKPPRVDPCG